MCARGFLFMGRLPSQLDGTLRGTGCDAPGTRRAADHLWDMSPAPARGSRWQVSARRAPTPGGSGRFLTRVQFANSGGCPQGISARVQEIVGRAAERAEVSLERILRELGAIAFSRISKAVTWGPSVQVREEEEDGQRVKVIVSALVLVPSDKLDENTAAAIAAVSQSSTGALRIRMHNKLRALVVLGKYLGMFDERPQNTNAVYAISDKPMTDDEWVRRYVTPL